MGDPIKILHVCESTRGGPSSYLCEILPFQIEQFGLHSVAVLVPDNEKFAFSNFPGLSVYTFNRDGRSVKSFVSLAKNLFFLLKDEKFSILHLHSTIAGVVGRIIGRFFGKSISILYCAHGWAFEPARRSRFSRFIIWTEKILSHFSDVIINISHHESNLLNSLNFNSNSFRTIVSGIGDIEQIPSEFDLDNDEPLKILFLGRFDRQKGLDLLLNEIENFDCKFHLTIVGANVVDTKSDQLSGYSNVAFEGWINRSEIPELFHRHDAVIMPSRWEGLPLVALEAMRSSKAVIGPNDGAFPFIIDHGNTGLLVDIYRPGFLGDAISDVSRNDFKKMGINGRQRYLDLFSSSRMNKEICDVYLDLLESRF